MTLFEIKTFYWAGYFSGKAAEPRKARDAKISNGFGAHCNLSKLSELYFAL